LFHPAALPAVLPIHHQELKAEGVDFQTGLEADAQVAVVHFVLVREGGEEGEVAGDGEEEIVVEGRQFRQFVFEKLRCPCCARTLLGDFVLHGFGEDFIGEVAQPGLKHGADGVDVVEVGFFEQVDVEFSVEAALPVFDFFAAAGDAVQAFFFAAVHVEVAVTCQ
jgi:hypothetical protein